MDIAITFYLLVLGLCFGSFALAMVDRMSTGRDWVRGRSECESCHTPLQIRDLLPVLSWALAKGRCRHCQVNLSVSYPLTELAVGAVFAASYMFWPISLQNTGSITQFVIWLLAVVVMAGLFLYDVRWYLLPNKLIYPLIALGTVYAAIEIVMSSASIISICVQYSLALLVGAGIFAFLHVVSKGKWIGDGDVRLGIAIALFTGSALVSWLVLFTASVIGLAVSIPAILSARGSKKAMKLKMPFGPPLMTALLIGVLFGERIIDWYTTFFLYL